MDTQFSRATPRRAAYVRPDPELRWQILDDLTLARTAFDLKDRTLQVLRALLSFLPKGETRRFTVFPSNRTLSNRLLGMPESTLRRHLALLRDAGLLLRRDSPNRKRYRVGSALDLTFGLDLTPLFTAAAHIRDTAREAVATRQRITELRASVRDRMQQLDIDDCNNLNRTLRRKLSEEALTHLLETLPQQSQEPPLPPESNVVGARNERHIHHQSKSELQPNAEEIARTAIEEVAQITGHPLKSERDIKESGRLAALAIGVADAWTVAQHRRGPTWAAMALAHIHRRLEKLHHPGAYLLSMTEKAGNGQFDIVAALASR